MNALTQRTAINASRGDSPGSTSTGNSQFETPTGWTQWERTETNVSELVLIARCEMAMARVTGPLDVRKGYEHARSARRWAFVAGRASLNDAPVPLAFEGSPTLLSGWRSGQQARRHPASGFSFLGG